MNLIRILFAAALLLATACGGRTLRSQTVPPQVTEPTRYTYRIQAAYPHSTEAYTQGLQYADGRLWEGTGQYGRSAIFSYALDGSDRRQHSTLPAGEFGEGITLLGDRLYQLTWESNTCHVYDRATHRKVRDFRYTGEGWGLTTDGEKLYMSNGTATIYRLDPATFRREASITVTLRGEPVNYLNELEWIEGELWANIYTTDRIVRIDPRTGVVEGIVDLTGLLPAEERTPQTDVLNGIAYDAAAKRIFVTGKLWPKIYEIELIKQ